MQSKKAEPKKNLNSPLLLDPILDLANVANRTNAMKAAPPGRKEITIR